MKICRYPYLIVFCIVLFFYSSLVKADDGSQLWLRYPINEKLRNNATSNVKSPTLQIAVGELNRHWKGQKVELKLEKLTTDFKDGFRIKSTKSKVILSAGTESGLLYGTYHLLGLQLQKVNLNNLNIEEKPSYDIRILNHWDNLDRTIERGYAGYSLWKWDELPSKISPRYKEYARANASIGINSVVLNNVNASPDILKPEYLLKVKALADIFRPYGIKVYLSINFASPKVIGGIENSDPFNPKVKAWWETKAGEIYKLIPDFGGFLVKANSEGQPGPQDYGRSHADGANMLADVLKKYKGIVMWRAFVYSETNEDRAKKAYLEFMPFDGKFRDNVIIQIKNGPIDFQPREPFTPLFGAMKETPQMVEFQITQEYFGFSNHLAFLAPLYKETLDSDTYSDGKGSTIAKLTDGTLRKQKFTALAGVANIGEDANWTGHHFAQANWYAFGRLAWNHTLSSEQIANEWIQMTFTNQQEFVNPLKEMMLSSREAVVHYMMPLGLVHIFASGHHYGPEPWGDYKGGRPDWSPVYYHRADAIGLGFDRTKTGSNAVSQYFPPLSEIYGNIKETPENLLLYFHHVPWNYKMKSGRIMWDELAWKYQTGINQTRAYRKLWNKLKGFVDTQRFIEVEERLAIQEHDAIWWKDACLQYFQEFSKMPFPQGVELPERSLEELKKIKLDMKHHN